MKPTVHYTQSFKSSLVKLHPLTMARNPVMLVVYIGSLLTSWMTVSELASGGGRFGFNLQLCLWLWLTVLFANFAEAVAEGRGKAQADSLRRSRQEVKARRLRGDLVEWVSSSELRSGDLIRVEAGEVIPADGEILKGVAAVNESAVTGESAPVVREAGGDRSAVTGGTTVLSDWLEVRVGVDPGQGFLDRMIAMVEGSSRKRTPNEIALSILLSSFTVVFLLVCVTLYPLSLFDGGRPPGIPLLIALLVCLIPTTIGGLLSAIGIAGMDRLIQRNVIALSGRAVEAAGDVDVLLLDKTGTITYGNRQAVQFYSAQGKEKELARYFALASLADETPEGKSVVDLARRLHGWELTPPDGSEFIPFSAETRMSGVNLQGQEVRKGAVDSVAQGQKLTAELQKRVEEIAQAGGTPLLLRVDGQILGCCYLKDVVKPGIQERFRQLKAMGIRTLMVTGDNPITAAAIAAEAGVDDFVAQATPEQKLELIRGYQARGQMVAMTGDGTNDAPALAQSDVAVAMQSGTQAAREAANLVDLDSDPTKLIEIVEIGKQLLMTRGALTTFSIANDVAKYFAILPALFAGSLPQLAALNFMGLRSPESAILSAVIFNALILVLLIPLALRGVPYYPATAENMLRRNLLIYGLGGLIVPFLGIWGIDFLVSTLGLA